MTVGKAQVFERGGIEREHMGDEGGKREMGVNDGQGKKGDSEQAKQAKNDMELQGRQREKKGTDGKNKRKRDRKL